MTLNTTACLSKAQILTLHSVMVARDYYRAKLRITQSERLWRKVLHNI